MPAPRLEGQLRIALLNPCYWPEVRRGSERFAHELACGLIARGHLPCLITSHPGRPTRTVEHGLRVIRVPRPPQGTLVRHGIESYLTHVPLSYLALRAGTYDVAHALYPADALAAARWGRKTHRPTVLTYMGIPTTRWLQANRGRRQILLRAIDGCDAVVALSRYAAQAFEESTGREVRTIHPGVDLDRFRRSAPRTEYPTIVCPAAVEEPRKHVALLVEALSVIRERHPDARLILSKPRHPDAIARAGLDGASDGVLWRDLDDDLALVRAYSEAWVVALPAADEAFGLVLTEGLACGTPVVGYADGGIPEIIDGRDTGRLFHRLEPDSLAEALLTAIELTDDPGTAERCRAHAEEFSAARCTERYLSLYRELG